MATPMRLASRRLSPRHIASRSRNISLWVRYLSSGRPFPNPGIPKFNTAEEPSRPPFVALFALAAVSGATVLSLPFILPFIITPDGIAGKEVETVPILIEEPRKRAASKEESREIVSGQHVQVKKSWERPGVYAWGSNAGKVAAPDSNEPVIKTPRRIPYFDGQLLRDMKLDRDFGVAITEKGDLVQWGAAFDKNHTAPVVTLKGKDLTKLAISRDRIIALSSNGSVYSLPVAGADQFSREKPANSSWFPFWSEASPLTYRVLKPQNMGWGEKIINVKSGLEHSLFLTSKGRVYSAASSTESFPAKGQLGIAGLTWKTRPEGPFDQPHEIGALSGFKIKSIATGDFHSLVLDDGGRVFAFGDNSTGQLGFEPEPSVAYADIPLLLPVTKLYSGTNMLPKVTSIAAGGSNSFFTVDATKVQSRKGGDEVVPAWDLGRVVSETWACGEGIKGSLGTGKWTHISSAPTKIKALSGLNEYDEKANSVVPIRLSHLSVGSLHACAILDNATHVDASSRTSSNDTNFGADVMFWGFNEWYQLGTGKRSNLNTPTYLGPLDGVPTDADLIRKPESNRFQITPRKTVRLGEGGSGRTASVEQRVECGRNVSAVYSGT